ncbi:MAG: hypothetical protein ABR985_04040 [Methanotrichaceae archaeon]
MEATLALLSDDLGKEDLQELTAELCRTLVDETNIDAELVEGKSEKGTRGGPLILGLIALKFLSSGAAVALFNVFTSYFDRKPYLELELRKNDGTKLSLKAKNIRLEDLNDFLGR